MLSEAQARTAISKAVPSASVEDVVRYRNAYLFRLKLPLPGEEDYDPFFSVDIQTGEVRDFSVITDGDIDEIGDLFARNQSTEGR